MLSNITELSTKNNLTQKTDFDVIIEEFGFIKARKVQSLQVSTS